MRVSKTSPRGPQEAMLREGGFTDFSPTGDVWIDEAPPRRPKPGAAYLPARAEVVGRARPGDRVVVASLAAWAPSAADGAEALRLLSERGADLEALDTGRVYRGGEAMTAALTFLADMEAAAKDAVMATARAAAAENRAARAAAQAGTKAEAEKLWKDKALLTEAILARVPFSESTMRRWWGPRQTARFTGGPKPKQARTRRYGGR